MGLKTDATSLGAGAFGIFYYRLSTFGFTQRQILSAATLIGLNGTPKTICLNILAPRKFV